MRRTAMFGFKKSNSPLIEKHEMLQKEVRGLREEREALMATISTKDDLIREKDDLLAEQEELLDQMNVAGGEISLRMDAIRALTNPHTKISRDGQVVLAEEQPRG
jgi:hypothetical protein